jgi:hypothetical protein
LAANQVAFDHTSVLGREEVVDYQMALMEQMTTLRRSHLHYQVGSVLQREMQIMAEFEYQASCMEEHTKVNQVIGGIACGAFLAAGVIATSPEYKPGDVSVVMNCCTMVKASLRMNLDSVPQPLRSKFLDFLLECVQEDLEFHYTEFHKFVNEHGLKGEKAEENRQKLEVELQKRDKELHGYL